jgi:hypothetical protein
MKIAIKRKKFFEITALLIILLVFAFGWLYLEVLFNVIQKPFDFEIYFENNEGIVIQENSINSKVIIFSDFNKSKPVEIYVSNCPQYSTCTLSINNANPTYTSDLTITPSELTTEGTYPINVFATGGGINKAATFYLTVKPKECICTPWISEGCGGKCGYQMYVVRSCQPKGCEAESRCAYNSSCIKDFSIQSIPSYGRPVNQKAYYTIKITSINGFSDLVYLTASNCPPGAVCSYSLSPVRVPIGGSATSTLTIIASLGSAIGDFTVTTTGFSNKTFQSTNSTITIT